ncbi:hypothetical protein [Pseudarthrobacter sulfonivorans]|jgi:hypothetical protein|nr:hypothetical protein [Pseudarthrobacter sulfonivorans]MDR6416095.1 hypothetical protein [Pseudarthrobacter sulfonivorans]
MLLLNSLNFLFDGGRREDGRGNSETEFPTGQLSSAAWEGWWHEDAA